MKNCLYCKKEFKPNTSAKYCSIKCRNKHYNEKRRIRYYNEPGYKEKQAEKQRKLAFWRREYMKKTGYMNNYMKQWRKKNREHYLNYRRKNYKKYSKKNREDCKKYLQTENGKIASKKHKAKRRRSLKFIPLLTNPFPKNIPVDYHHINTILTIPLPTKTHQYICGVRKKEHNEWNYKMIKKIYQINIDKLLK